MFWGQKTRREKFRFPPFPAEVPVADPRCFLSVEGSAHPQFLLSLPGSKDFCWSFQKPLTRYTRRSVKGCLAACKEQKMSLHRVYATVDSVVAFAILHAWG